MRSLGDGPGERHQQAELNLNKAVRISFDIAVSAILAFACLADASLANAQAAVFRRTLEVGLKDPVVLDIVVETGDLAIGYNRDGEVSIYASGKDSAGNSATEEYFNSHLILEQDANHITLRNNQDVSESVFSVSYRIDVPFRTQINSSVLKTGNQRVIGVTGPVKMASGEGNIDATYVRFALVQATTGKGRISCTRVAHVSAETGSGNITLLEDGSSKAVVKSGFGRIEIGGARGSVEAATQSGDVHIKAVLDGDWRLSSVNGNIRIELPPRASFEINADTISGAISIERDGIENPSELVHEFHQKVNNGGKHIEAHSGSGNIYIQ